MKTTKEIISANESLLKENIELRIQKEKLLEAAKYMSARLLQIDTFLPKNHKLKEDAKAGWTKGNEAIAKAKGSL